MAIFRSEPAGFKFHYPTDAAIKALLTVPPELREAVLRKCLSGASEAEKDPHIARVMERLKQSEQRIERRDVNTIQGTRTPAVRQFRVAKAPERRAVAADLFAKVNLGKNIRSLPGTVGDRRRWPGDNLIFSRRAG